jgi:hypothetical protein
MKRALVVCALFAIPLWGASPFAFAFASAGASPLAHVAAQSGVGSVRSGAGSNGATTSSGAQAGAATESPRGLRARFGLDAAERSLRSTETAIRIDGIERAASIGSADAVALLVQAAEPSSPIRQDGRALIALARALSRFVDRDNARDALASLANTPAASPPRGPSGRATADDGDLPARIELARRIAARALATSDKPRAAELLVAIARGGGPGQEAALVALAANPPKAAQSFVSGTMSAGTLRLIGTLSDLRAIDAVRGALSTNDPAARAAAFLAAGELGDTRAIEPARAALTDPDPRVRAAGGIALVRLRDADAARAIERLLADRETAETGIELAPHRPDEGVVRALAALAVTTTDRGLARGAVLALGTSPRPSATEALASMLGRPDLRGDAAFALATSPDANANARLRRLLAQGGAMRRLAVRALFVRERGGRRTHGAFEEGVAGLRTSRDADDRALLAFLDVDRAGAASRVVARGLADPEPAVRRAAAMAAVMLLPATGRSDAADLLLAALGTEADARTRAVLAGALGHGEGDRDARVPMTTLTQMLDAGGTDSLPATVAFTARAAGSGRERARALLASRDPLVRLHAARGLGMSAAAEATGELVNAYAFEVDERVRFALVAALAKRRSTATARVAETLAVAAALDPSAAVRSAASAAQQGGPTSPARADGAGQSTWIELRGDAEQGPVGPFDGVVIGPDGLARPVAFDRDGFALVLELGPGSARLLLASSGGSYDSTRR